MCAGCEAAAAIQLCIVMRACCHWILVCSQYYGLQAQKVRSAGGFLYIASSGVLLALVVGHLLAEQHVL